MSAGTAASAAFGWSAHLVRSLYEEGIRHVVISPGSRSTSLALACASHAGMELTVALDERSAGFIALGIGKTHRQPAALLCTSGTAGANYAPSVWEARNSGTAMIVLTADRPPSLRGTGSSQTMDQIKLFGDAPVFFHECGEPRTDPAAMRRLSFAVKQAVQDARILGGAAHLNLPFDKPFEPGPTDMEREERWNAEQIKRMSVESVRTSTESAPQWNPTMSSGSGPVHLLESCRRPVIVAGPMNPSDPLRSVWGPGAGLDGAVACPVLADAGALPPTADALHAAALMLPSIAGTGTSSNGSTAGSHSGTPFDGLHPDLIIRIGDTPFSGHLTQALELWSDVPTLLITSRPTWQHPFGGPVERWICRSAEDVRRFLAGFTRMESGWLDAWREVDARTQARLASQWARLLGKGEDADPDSPPVPAAKEPARRWLSDLEAVHKLWSRIPEESCVMLSNSLIPRDVALLQPLMPARETIVNRGVAGIDGITSTAVGIALARSQPVWLLIGDLAFLHDSNALLQHSALKVPVAIGLIDNGGGSIFRSLPVHSTHPESFRRLFETPQSVDVGLLCRAHGIPYHRIQHPMDLDAIPEPRQPGFVVFDVKTDPDRSHRQRNALRRHLREPS